MDNLEKLCKWIKENFDSLPISKIGGDSKYVDKKWIRTDAKELVIFATGKFEGEYGFGSSDLESWGVDREGKLFWAFASGCSCSCSSGVEDINNMTLKLFEVEKRRCEVTNIKDKVELFISDINSFKESLDSYDYCDW